MNCCKRLRSTTSGVGSQITSPITTGCIALDSRVVACAVKKPNVRLPNRVEYEHAFGGVNLRSRITGHPAPRAAPSDRPDGARVGRYCRLPGRYGLPRAPRLGEAFRLPAPSLPDGPGR